MGKKILYAIFVVTLTSVLTASAATVLKLPGGGLGHSTSTKGDLFVGNNTTSLGRVPVGADGLVLKASSGAAFGVAYETDSGLTTSTGLGVLNFSSANVSQWTNDSGYVNGTGTASFLAYFTAARTLASTSLFCIGDVTCTGTTTTLNVAVTDDSHAHTASTISGLSTADFTSANISNWTNDAGYTTYASGGPWTASVFEITNIVSSSQARLNSSTIPNLFDSQGTRYSTNTASGDYLTSGNLDSEIASSSPSFNIYDATTTNGYQYAKWRTNRALTLRSITCDEYAAATGTWDFYKQSSLATTTVGTLIATSTACGIGGTTVTAFNTSSLAAGDFLFASTTVVAGTPKWTAINFYFLVND